MFGPDLLGRGIVVRPGASLPEPFPDAPRVRIDQTTLVKPSKTIAALHDAWFDRRRIVIELHVPVDDLKLPESTQQAPWEVGPRFEFSRERLHFLTWANTYDATRGDAIWWHGRLAERLGAKKGRDTDIILPNGQAVWCDGGPRTPLPFAVLHRESIENQQLTLTSPAAPPQAALAQDQLDAVRHPFGPARIIAPAGSGKTRVLTERLRHLLVDRGWERDLVTAVCYNRRAAEELKSRTAAFKPRVQTLHALGYAILNRIRPRQVLDDGTVRQWLRPLVKIDPQPNQDPLATWLEALSDVRIGLAAPKQVQKDHDDLEDFERVLQRWRALLADRQAVDHDEQIYGAIEVLLQNPDERRYWQRQCRHLLVDEFQDLTPSYLLMIRLLASPAFQVFGVGDDDQVIYGYAGATPDYLIRYDQYFPRATPYALEVNYRCPAPVVKAASTLLSYNQRRVAKTIHPSPHASSEAWQAESTDSGGLATRAVARIQQWLDAGFLADEVAVLTRVTTSLLPAQLSLLNTGIACRTAVNETLLTRTGIHCALTYLRMGQGQPWTREDIRETIRRPARKISRAVSDRLERRPVWTARDLRTLAHDLQDWEADRLEEYLDDLARLSNTVHKGSTRDVLRVLRTQIGLDQSLQGLDQSGPDRWSASHVDDLKALEQVAALHPNVSTFESWLSEGLRVQSKQGVTLSTIHRVKGMEWPCVLLLDASDGLMPHRLADDVEEERRIFHVGVTRARRHLLLLSEQKAPSSFLRELSQSPEEKPRKPRPHGIRAEVGLPLEALGYQGTISDVKREYVLLKIPGSTTRLTITYGEVVRSDGRVGPLLTPVS
ncbi:MAG TPA: ATP-dependent helicase [Candidatus Xenobia bacterium]